MKKIKSLDQALALLGLEVKGMAWEDSKLTVADAEGNTQRLTAEAAIILFAQVLADTQAELKETLELGNVLITRAAQCASDREQELATAIGQLAVQVQPYGDPWAIAPVWAEYAVPVVHTGLIGMPTLMWAFYACKPKLTIYGYEWVEGTWTRQIDTRYEQPEPMLYTKGS